MRIAILWMHFPLAQCHKPTAQSHLDTTILHALPPSLALRRKPTTHSHLDTTITMRFATLLAQRRKATTQTTTQPHLNTAITIRSATLCMRFHLAQRRKPTALSHLDTIHDLWFHFPMEHRSDHRVSHLLPSHPPAAVSFVKHSISRAILLSDTTFARENTAFPAQHNAFHRMRLHFPMEHQCDHICGRRRA